MIDLKVEGQPLVVVVSPRPTLIYETRFQRVTVYPDATVTWLYGFSGSAEFAKSEKFGPGEVTINGVTPREWYEHEVAKLYPSQTQRRK